MPTADPAAGGPQSFALLVNGRPVALRADPDDLPLSARRVLDEAPNAEHWSHSLHADDPPSDDPNTAVLNDRAGRELEDVDPQEHDRVIALRNQ
jgi:hypothetical protein